MKLSSDLKKSLAAYTADLKGDISITLQKGSHKKRDELVTFLNDVCSVSRTHKAWHKSSDVVSKVQYTLISDDQFKLSKQFKVLRKGEGRADRGTFIIDPNGVIQAYEITSEGIGRDAQDLLRKVKAAQYVYANPDEVCPAKWQEGEDTLTPSLDLSGKI